MNTIYPTLKPIFEAWDYFMSDPYRSDLEEFLSAPGYEWIAK